MKIQELIQKLKQYPADMEVYALGTDIDSNEFRANVHQPGLDLIRVKDFKMVNRPTKNTTASKKSLLIC